MDAASTAVSSLFSKASADTSTADKPVTPVAKESTQKGSTAEPPADGQTNVEKVDKQVAPAVTHEKVKDVHETRTQTEVEKEVHQDHYHTTVQPLKDREVQGEVHDHKAGKHETKEFEHDDVEGTKKKVAEQQKGQQFENSTTQDKEEKSVDEGKIDGGTHVHHHLHETIQPVIEKETVKPSVTHVKDHVKEKHHAAAKLHGTTVNEAISVDDFKGNLNGAAKSQSKSEAESKSKTEL
ncbi:hypothetical protein K504DRAFT_499865 [Pleomassaria siparia CBS 279.74]|uniref:Allergen n=1 Tax=Pleomassaria siparia CBS 279.74 TaxID=1314801 RepID=A0A6G1KJ33_9PLEO|nr:hypothetical protein K504DRAFT_499865 [Pleomassaria siparia CBS 279.74]